MGKKKPKKAGRRAGAATRRVDHDLRILNAIRRIIRTLEIDSRRLADHHDITAPQLLSLMALVEKGSHTAHSIAARIHVSASTLVGVLDRLEAKGFIQRERSTTDRREIKVAPTEAGRKLVADTPFPLQHALDRALGRLKAPEREVLASWMERLVELMEVGELEATPMLEFRSLGEG